jgi:hypothetical protein
MNPKSWAAVGASLLLTAAALAGCGSSAGGGGNDGRIRIGANDSFDYGAKAADVASAFGCGAATPFHGALDADFADAVSCTGASRIVLLVATFTNHAQYAAAVSAVSQHASQQGQGAAVAQGGTFLVTVDVDADQPAGVHFDQESAVVREVSDFLGISFGSTGPPN